MACTQPLLTVMLLVTLAACGQGSGDASPTSTDLAEQAAGIEVRVDPIAHGDSVEYVLEVRNTTEQDIRIVSLGGGRPEVEDDPDDGPGARIFLYYRRTPTQPRDEDASLVEAPPTYKAFIVLAGQSLTLQPDTWIGLDSEPGPVTVCAEVEDIPGKRSEGRENGAETQMYERKLGQPAQLACSAPTQPKRPT